MHCAQKSTFYISKMFTSFYHGKASVAMVKARTCGAGKERPNIHFVLNSFCVEIKLEFQSWRDRATSS